MSKNCHVSAVLFLLCLVMFAGNALGQTVYTVNGPEITATVNGKTVFTGKPKLFDATPFRPIGQVQPPVEGLGATVFLTTSWEINGEVATGTFEVNNKHATLTYPWICMAWPDWNLPADSDFGRIRSIQASLQINGQSIMHPTGGNTGQPIGAWWAKGGGVGLGFSPLDLHETPCILIRRPPGANPVSPCFFLARPVAPGETYRFKVAITASANTDFRNLIAPYKASYSRMYRRNLHISTLKPVVCDFGISREALVTATNPNGYRPGFRMDQPDPDQFVIDQAKYASSLGCTTLFIWDISGWHPPMQNPEFLRPYAVSSLTKLTAAARPLRIAIGGRMGKCIDPITNEIRPRRSPEEIAHLYDMVDQALKAGVTCFYGDELGEQLADVGIARTIRMKQITAGIADAGFAEFISDSLLPYVAGYTTVSFNGSSFYLSGRLSEGDLAVFDWLMPGVPVYAQVKYVSDDQFLSAAKWCVDRNMIPLVHLWKTKDWVPPVRLMLENATDPNTGWWRNRNPLFTN